MVGGAEDEEPRPAGATSQEAEDVEQRPAGAISQEAEARPRKRATAWVREDGRLRGQISSGQGGQIGKGQSPRSKMKNQDLKRMFVIKSIV